MLFPKHFSAKNFHFFFPKHCIISQLPLKGDQLTVEVFISFIHSKYYIDWQSTQGGDLYAEIS